MRPALVTLTAPTIEEAFRALGTEVRVIVSGHGARSAVEEARRAILDYHVRLSRFLPLSELSTLNRDPRPVAPASGLLRSAVSAAIRAAKRSGGLVDPCLLDALVTAGYARSYEADGALRLPSGPIRSARPHPEARWRDVRVDDVAGTIERPTGLRFDLGGTGKGHVADLIAGRLGAFSDWAVDCGGDVRVGGIREVQIAHPLRSEPAARLSVADGAIATSSVVSRAWTTSDGDRAHHLLDPRSGSPVWTGLLTATALAPTTLEAETLAKVALLRGPIEAREALAHGGVLIHAGGSVETVASPAQLAA